MKEPPVKAGVAVENTLAVEVLLVLLLVCIINACETRRRSCCMCARGWLAGVENGRGHRAGRLDRVAISSVNRGLSRGKWSEIGERNVGPRSGPISSVNRGLSRGKWSEIGERNVGPRSGPISSVNRGLSRGKWSEIGERNVGGVKFAKF